MDKHHTFTIDQLSPSTRSNFQPKPIFVRAINAIKIRTSAGILSLLALTGCNDESIGNVQINADTSITSPDASIHREDILETVDAIQHNEVRTRENEDIGIIDEVNIPDIATATDTSMSEDVSETSEIEEKDTFIDNTATDSNDNETCTNANEVKMNPNAVNVIGQYVNSAILYTSGSPNNGSETANTIGLFAPHAMTVDTTNHRLFVSDTSNNRILVYNLTNSNTQVSGTIADYTADAVLGQANFTANAQGTTSQTLAAPEQLVYDSTNNLLYVADYGNKRVLIYDVAAITDGEAAVKVLGQANFTSSEMATTISGFRGPRGLALDSSNNRLFVSDAQGNHRVMVFNVATITNGEDAVNVLGQTDFTSSTTATSQGRLSSPYSLAYDSTNSRLFVNDAGNYRVMVFNVASISDGENAVNELGQTSFTANTMAATQSGMSYAYGVAYDSTNDRLFVGDTPNNRVVVYDTAAITDGEAAVNVLGQTTFTGLSAATTQSGLSAPYGIAYESGNGYAYVSDSANNRVMVFDAAVNPGSGTPEFSTVTLLGTLLIGMYAMHKMRLDSSMGGGRALQ